MSVPPSRTRTVARRVVTGAVVGAGCVAGTGVAANALVPGAMACFGKVILGVGTMHAGAAAGGVAANLQGFSAVASTSGALYMKAMAAGGLLHGIKPSNLNLGARAVVSSTSTVMAPVAIGTVQVAKFAGKGVLQAVKGTFRVIKSTDYLLPYRLLRSRL